MRAMSPPEPSTYGLIYPGNKLRRNSLAQSEGLGPRAPVYNYPYGLEYLGIRASGPKYHSDSGRSYLKNQIFGYLDP